MLAVGDLAQSNLALGVTEGRDIDHQSEGIAALRRNEHTCPPIVTGTKPGLFVPNPMQAEQTNLIIMSLI